MSSTLHVWSAVVEHFQNHLTDLIHSVSNCELSMYADDRQRYSIGPRIHDVEKNLNNDGNDVSNWYTTNLLQGNFSKYQAISLGRKSTNTEINVVIMGTEVTNYPELKLLGVSIESQMNFKGHVSDVCKRASKQLGVLLRLRNMIPMHAKLQIYKSAILPLLTYCHVVWHFCCLSDTIKLERVQEKALRAIYCNRNDTYEDLLKMAKLPTLYNRRLQDIAILMYKIKHNQCPKYISDLFKRTWCNQSPKKLRLFHTKSYHCNIWQT